ncbi:MAG: acyl-CoA dehydrogenase family protein [Rhizobacter sp.]|nr:acyl-CoA dehydrogenase family protein [Chlorobiales bacterium]
MNFTLSEEHKLIQEAARDFAAAEIKDAIERDEASEFPHAIIPKLGEMGFMGMMVPPEYDGAGMDAVSYVLAMEEISKVDASVGVVMSVNNSLVCWGINEHGTEAQKQKYLRPLAKAQNDGKLYIGAFCLSEPDAGSDATHQSTNAYLDGDHWVLNGAKNWITNGTTAEVYLVFATTDKSKGSRGISCFIVERGTKGFDVLKKEKKLGIRSSDTCSLGFTDCHIPTENMLGPEGEGFKIAMKSLDGGRIGIAAQALGIAAASLEKSIKYAGERKSFGKPIFEHQAIQMKLADMATELDGARLLVLQAAWMKDQGMKYSRQSAMCKLFASRIAVKAALEAIQIHGGYGYVQEYEVERYLRDAKITEIYEGTSEVQHIVIARDLLRD